MKRLPRGKPAQIMGSRGFQTMYTAEQMRKAVADEREQCAALIESRKTGANELMDAVRDMEAKAIRARADT